MNIVICDDITADLKEITKMVRQFMEGHPEYDINLCTFQSSHELLAYLNARQEADIYILDIIMPDLNGIDIGHIIREQNQDAVIIYTTASAEFAVSSYSVQAFHYLLKPVEKELLFETLSRCMEKISTERARYFEIKTAQGMIYVPFGDIVYAEIRRHILYLSLKNGEELQSVTQRVSFDKLTASLMSDRRFLKISSCYVINMNYVSVMNNSEFIMSNQKRLTYSKVIGNPKKAYMEYMLWRSGGGKKER